MNDAVLIGGGSVGVRALRVLQSCGVKVALVVADPRDSGEDTWRDSLVKAARGSGYVLGETLLQPKNPNTPDVLARIESISPRVIFSAHCAAVLRPPLVSGERWWVVNWHNAPLPLLRGCDPFAWAILDGLTTMGVTLHLIEDVGIDCGPILAQALWSIREDATAWDLYLEALHQGEELLRRTAVGIVERSLQPCAQEHRFSSYHPPGQIDFGQVEICWAMPAKALSAWIRARVFPPMQMPYFLWRGERVEVRRCRALTAARAAAGVVISVSPLQVATSRGAVELMELGWQGRVLTGAEWAAQAQVVTGGELK